MNWDTILKIPFISKKKYLGRGKYSFSGNVYYLLDKEGQVLRDFLILDDDKEQEYRANDNNMMIGKDGTGTDFWKSPFVNGYREKIFENSFVNSEIKKATLEIIHLLNEHSIKKANTALSTEGFISGSNSSGADSKIEASPLVINDSEFYGLRFVNPMKKMRKNSRNHKAAEKYPINIKTLEKVNTMDLKSYLDKFKQAKKHFYSYNPESYNLIYNDEEWDTVKIYLEDLKKKELKNEEKSNLENVERILKSYFEGNMKKKILISRLRGFQRLALLIEYNLKQKSTIIGMNEKPGNMDAAHLVEVRSINKDVDLYLIANKDNGLLLPKDIHWKFDKDETYYLNSNFEFTQNGKVVAKVSKEYINDSRRKYIEQRNSNI